MNCSEIKKRLSAFIDGETDGTVSRIIEQHLEGCPDCRKYLHEFNEVDDMVYALPKIEVSPDFTSRVVSEAIRTSVVGGITTASFTSRAQSVLAWLSDAVFSLFEPGATPNTSTLDEFNDCPPLSMSFVYLSLLGQGHRGY